MYLSLFLCLRLSVSLSFHPRKTCNDITRKSPHPKLRMLVPALGFPVSRIVTNACCCSSHLLRGVLLKQPELMETITIQIREPSSSEASWLMSSGEFWNKMKSQNCVWEWLRNNSTHVHCVSCLISLKMPSVPIDSEVLLL